MNKSLTLNKSKFPLLQTHSRKSLLTLAIITSLGTSNSAYAGETINCIDASCASQLYAAGGFYIGSLVPSLDASGNTQSLEKNIINYNWPDNPDVDYVYGAYTNVDNENVIENTINMDGGDVDFYVIGGIVYDNALGQASKNIVNVNKGIVNWDAIGGESNDGEASLNKVYVNAEGTVRRDVFGAITDGNGDTKKNETHIKGTVTRSVYGGNSSNGTGEAIANIVTIDSGSVSENAVGGVSNDGSRENEVTVEGDSSVNSVFGGYAKEGNADKNIVKVNGGNISLDVIGGKSDKGQVTQNNTILTNGEINRYLKGGVSKKGDVLDNEVNINGGSVGEHVYGGQSFEMAFAGSSFKVAKNRVIVTDGNITKDVYGGSSMTAEVIDNSVLIKSGTIGENVYGGITAFRGDTKNNTVTIENGIVHANVLGAYSKDAATGNKVIIKGGHFDATVTPTVSTAGIFGAYAHKKEAISNSVVISDGDFSQGVYGGFSDNGSAEKNTIDISKGTINGESIAGYSLKGDAIGNTLTLNKGDVKNIMAGYAEEGIAKDNILNINGGTADWSQAYAGKAKNGDVNHNIANMSDGKVGFYLYAGYSDESGNVTDNTLNMSGGEAGFGVYGGYANSTNNVERNTVSITKGDVKGTGVFGGFSWGGDVLNNKVNIDNGSIEGLVVGGRTGGTGNATENNVVINGGTIDATVNGGRANTDQNHVIGTGNATKNIVIINRGTVKEDIVGGNSGEGNATNNEVTINNGSIDKNIFGGFTAKGNAINNTITVKNSPSFNTTNTILYGGGTESQDGSSGDIFTGNTLNLHSKDITIFDVKNFENYNFYLDNDVLDGSIMLKLTSTDATDLSTSKYGVGVKTGTTSLPQGYTVTLIESATALTLSSQNPANDITNMTDIVSGYEFRLSVKDGNKLVAELPYTVTIVNSDTSKGIVTKTDEQAYHGETITFDATPIPGYKVSINNSSECGSMGSWSSNTYTSSEITDKCTITVNWEEINYTIGGTVSGLNGSITLQNNTGNDLTINADGAFTFTTTAVHDDNYSVTVSSQPAGQECSVDNGSGTINDSNISDITVTCSDVITIGTIFSDSFE